MQGTRAHGPDRIRRIGEAGCGPAPAQPVVPGIGEVVQVPHFADGLPDQRAVQPNPLMQGADDWAVVREALAPLWL